MQKGILSKQGIINAWHRYLCRMAVWSVALLSAFPMFAQLEMPVDAVATSGTTVTSPNGDVFSFTIGQSAYTQFNTTDGETEEGVQHTLVTPCTYVDAEVCDSFSWYGRRYTASTNDTIVIPDIDGQDSVLILRLIVHHKSDTMLYKSVCRNQVPWDWNGLHFENAGIQSYTLHNIFGCDSVVNHRLMLNETYSVIDDKTVCRSELPYSWSGVTFNDEGSRREMLQSIYGCDSLVLMRLSVYEYAHSLTVDTTCHTYMWNVVNEKRRYVIPGTHTDISRQYTPSGCLSLDTLVLTLYADSSRVFPVVACSKYVWTHRGIYTGTYTETDKYARSYIDGNGCRATDTLALTLRGATNLIDNRNVCDSLVWYGNTYYESTSTPRHVTTDKLGCDSIRTLNLVVRHSSVEIEQISACDSLDYQGIRYYASASFKTNKTNAMGCDSAYILQLSVGHTSPIGIDSVWACDRYTWINRQTYFDDISGVRHTMQNASGCDSTRELVLTLRYASMEIVEAQSSGNYTYRGTVYVHSGDYSDTMKNVAGCDSVTMLRLSIIQGAPLPHIVAYENKTVMIDHYPYGANNARVDYSDYRWYHDGTLIPAASADHYYLPGYSPLHGSYYAEVPTGEEKERWVMSNVINFDAVKRQSVAVEESLFTIHPNPVVRGTTITVTLANNELEIVPGSQLTIYTVEGREVFSMPVTSVEHTIVADWPAGIYAVAFHVPGRDTKMIKLMVR